VQTLSLQIAGVSRQFPSGLTLVIDVSGQVRFVIGSANLAKRTQELERSAQFAKTSPLGWETVDPNLDPFAVDYRGMHEMRI
jgi:hypothetical protein